MRSRLKRQVERVLGSRTVGRLTRHRTANQVLVLAYHGVVPHGEVARGERALFVSQAAFAAQLDALRELADVVPLADLDAPAGARPRVAVTFDDAYTGAVTCAVDELVRRSMPATIFVAPGRLDGHVFWWDALADGAGALDAARRTHALEALRGVDEAVRTWAARERVPSGDALPPHARAATLDQLRACAARPGITVGSHSWSHANLAALDADALEAELRQPLAWLREHFPARSVDWIAYPYGCDSAAVHEAARGAGYAGGLRIAGGWHASSEAAAFARPRLNISAGLSLDGFRARLQGVIRR